MKDPHIENPIPYTDWRCPKCGERESFYVDEVYDCGIQNCERFHEGDIVVCCNCGGSWTLKEIIKMWSKKNNMVRCPHCNGTGWIKGEDLQ